MPPLRTADEFPDGASSWPSGVSRRDFLKLMGASFALAGISGCNRQPAKEIVPFTNPPEAGLGREGLYYASAYSREGYARGILVEAHSGRPTKIEGNPNHPESLGATDAETQASVLSLYDPDRSQTPMHGPSTATWIDFENDWAPRRTALAQAHGAGFAVLTEPTTSPTLLREIDALLQRWPEARWYQHTALARYDDDGTQTDYDFENADIIVSFDADFLIAHPAALRYSRKFVQRRRRENNNAGPNRLYVAEPTLTLTGAIADARLALAPTEIADLIEQLDRAFGLGTDDAAPASAGRSAPHGSQRDAFIQALARDLKAHAPRVALVSSNTLHSESRTVLHDLHHRLGALGVAVKESPAVRSDSDARARGDLHALVDAIEAGEVSTLFILETNPVYASNRGRFAEALIRVKHAVHLGTRRDETAHRCHWHLPASHYLESWGDLRAFEGTASIVQPLVEPLYQTRNAAQILRLVTGLPAKSDYDMVRETWSRNAASSFDEDWRDWLDQGVVPNAVASRIIPQRRVASATTTAPRASTLAASETKTMFALFRLDPNIGAGEGSNNPWLQELPKPFTHLVWDNAALLSTATAQHLSLENGDVAEFVAADASLHAPIWIVAGQSDNCVILPLGYGRTAAGSVGNNHGFDAFAFAPPDGAQQLALREIRKTGKKHPLVSTHGHSEMEGRDLARVISVDTKATEPAGETEMSLYPDVHYTSYAWGMSIDLTSCTGCNACVIACQAENNIPTVGKEQVSREREMHWIRIDRYISETPNGTRVVHQPVPCMHCEHAPCELVCPVAATVHSSEGLNEMVYNRCVGTRYCSNNCPYKVRRFNFLDFREPAGSTVYLQKNPNVSIRDRGVMEKCTYCVQRINAGRIRAERENRTVRDGEILTACQQVCPTEAIVFGDLSDPQSKVSRRKREPGDYALLAELNTRPRTTYLPKQINPPSALPV
ncbi:MAG TPA: TAT-variant-translocated molybdopterin oxidoreductase [Opitutaceae bacterium]|nr:TAT-variant-translocated molybdopterin oxidoreductase [Opitutaceae bacterium]